MNQSVWTIFRRRSATAYVIRPKYPDNAMHNRRSLLTSAAATFFGVASCKSASADEAEALPIFLHIYSNARGLTYDQDRQNRRRTRSTESDWVRVVTILIVPDHPVFLRLPGGRDPDITVSGRIERRGSEGLHGSLKIAWDDSYITEQHEVSGKLEIGELHPSSTIQCRYAFSHSKDAYDVLDEILKR